MNQFKKILIPTDGSEYTKKAIAQGLEIAKLMNAEVTALYVVDQTSFVNFPMDSTVVSIYSLLEKEGQDAVDYVVEEGAKIGVKVTAMLQEGSPVKKIVDVAKDHDLVVMGTIGRTGISKILLGSVAERVVRFAPCPVLVVRSCPKEE
ncbi:MAG TPA: universal stress protein [Methanomassiliicoccaceae archaeon]|jgi:nucleotide-binding universal stress UspA family protein|nr:universal stress protein [Euryarchaeota archaeon]HOB38023.1 universal stress protein [Methanomassiliicoccaceae archaeon]HOL07534.1 universal stress protein [Methanomassiliicoccaceae archaeon]HOQ25789.1 universal stress protein [Methanomassiliicoccaceae archaeon]HPP44933.1 universal stress protein [Methanomassiliicoccaceae archaeon]